MKQIIQLLEREWHRCTCGTKPALTVETNPYEPKGCYVAAVTCPVCGKSVGPYGVFDTSGAFAIAKWEELIKEERIEQTNLQAMKENGMLDDEEEPLVELKEQPAPKPNTKPFLVEVKETYKKKVVIWAENDTVAEKKADELFESGAIDLSRNCYDGHHVHCHGLATGEHVKILEVY